MFRVEEDMAFQFVAERNNKSGSGMIDEDRRGRVEKGKGSVQFCH